MTLTTTKITMINGNWRRVPVVLTRVGNGWNETPTDPRTALAPKPVKVEKAAA